MFLGILSTDSALSITLNSSSKIERVGWDVSLWRKVEGVIERLLAGL